MLLAPVETTRNANVLLQLPIPALRSFIKRFVIVEFPMDRTLKLLPTTNFVAEFRFSGEKAYDGGAVLPRAIISGLRDTAQSRIYIGRSAILLAIFTEVGATAFLGRCLDDFFNTAA